MLHSDIAFLSLSTNKTETLCYVCRTERRGAGETSLTHECNILSSLQSLGETEVSIVAQNKDCYESGIVCMKVLVIHVGLTKIYFTDNSGNPVYTTDTHSYSVFTD